VATFAELVGNKTGDRAFGIAMQLYNYSTSTAFAFSVTNSDRFSPEYDAILVECSQPTFECRFLGGANFPPDVSFKILDKRVQASPAGDLCLSDRFAAGFAWYGQELAISLLIWDEIAKAIRSQAIWVGVVTECNPTGDGEIDFVAMHKTKWLLDKPFPPDTITAHDYPNAGPGVLGMPVPYVWGDNRAIPTDDGASDAYNLFYESMGLGDTRRVVPAYCWDRSIVGTNGPEHVISGLQLKEIATAATQAVFADVGSDALAPLASTAYIITNDASGGRVEIYREYKVAVPIRPDKAAAGDDTANTDYAFDGDLDTYCELGDSDYDFRANIPSPPDLGAISKIEVKMNCELPVTLGVGEYYEFGLYDIGAGAWLETPDHVTTDGNKTYTVSATIYRVSDLPGELAIRAYPQGINYGTDPTHVLRIAECALVVTYRCRQRLDSLPFELPAMPKLERLGIWKPGVPSDVREPDLTKLFVSCKGEADDGSGTYTGTASALIERPSSIIHRLAVLAGVTAVTGTTHGSFATARTGQATDGLTARISANKKTTYSKTIQGLADQSLSAVFTPPGSTAKLGIIYWNTAAATNLYGTAIRGEDVLSFAAGWTPLDDVRNAIYINCEYDYRAKKCVKQAFADGADSDDGLGTDDYTAKATLAASETRCGRRELEMQADYLSVEGAHEVRNGYGAMLPAPRVGVNLVLPWKYYDVEAGHVLQMDNASFLDASQHRAYKYPGLTDSTAGYWSHGAATRYFWVERMAFDLNGFMEIETTEGVW
jgi:hypothetical protein